MLYDQIVCREPVEKGWSGDKKYCAVTADGTKYLLRVSPIEQYDRKNSEFELMQRVAALGVPMCEALEFSTCDEGVYSVFVKHQGDRLTLVIRLVRISATGANDYTRIAAICTIFGYRSAEMIRGMICVRWIFP